MDGGLTLHSALVDGLSGLGIFTFKWVPAAVISLSGSADSVGSPNVFGPIGAPVTFPQATNYLQNISLPGTYDQFLVNWGLFAAFSIFVSLILASILIYCVIRLMQVRKFERERFEAASKTVATNDVSRTQLRWKRVMGEMATESEQSWRLAVLEADIMLNELLDSLGYRGETMADKMRAVERADFNTIDYAWEAHRARNRIAHEGSQTPLSHDDARRIVGLYERVFREFKFVE